MSLNQRILQGIDEKTKDDPKVRKLLRDLVFQEASGKMGWWKDKYREIIRKYVGGEEGEDN